MKAKNILDAMGGIDDELILDAAPIEKTKKKITWHRYGAMAACLALVTAGALAVSMPFISQSIEPGPSETTTAFDVSRYTFAESQGIFGIKRNEEFSNALYMSDWLVNVIQDEFYENYLSSRVINAFYVGEMLDTVTVKSSWHHRVGEETDIEYLQAEIYEIRGVDPTAAVCLRYIDKGSSLTTTHYYTFINTEFAPSTLGEFFEAFAAEKYFSVEMSALIDSIVYGENELIYHQYQYDEMVANKIAEKLLLCDAKTEILTDEAHEEIIKNCTKQARIRYDLPSTGIVSGLFYVTDNGYLLHVWNETAYYYEIGAKTARDIIGIICEGEPYQAPSEDMTVTYTSGVCETSAAAEPVNE